MPFVPKKQAFNARINEVTLGVGEKRRSAHERQFGNRIHR